MNILVLGHKGMLGSYLYSYYLQKGYNVLGIEKNSLDATSISEEELFTLLSTKINSSFIVINCMGIIKQIIKNFDICNVITINSIFPHKLAKVCNKLGAKCFHITTDCVYDGKEGGYNENSLHTCNDTYGKTKSLGEPINCCTIRTSIIGEESSTNNSLLNWTISKKNSTVNGYVNHFWNGVTCLELAKIIEKIIQKNLYYTGIKHIFSPEVVTKYDLIKMFSEVYDLNIKIIKFTCADKCDRSLSSIHSFSMDLDTPSILQQIKDLKKFKK